MAKTTQRLNNSIIEAITEPGLYPDGDGLFLQVKGSKGRSWIFKYTFQGQSHEMGLGSLRAFNLTEARKRAREKRQLISDGIDPLQAKRAQRAQKRLEKGKARTFRQEAESYINTHSKTWRNDKHGNQWRNTMEAYAYPVLGDLPVADIDTTLVMKVLEPIWHVKTETAHRVRGRIERVLNRAKSQGYCSGENPARWRGHLENIFPSRHRVAPVVHHPSLPYRKVGKFMEKLREQPGIAAKALELTILTVMRTKPIILAEPHEFDLRAKVWTIPAWKMKGNVEFRVPLSDQAVALVRGLGLQPDAKWLFPNGRRDNKPISNVAMLALLERMGCRDDVTTHGFRSTFRVWASEMKSFPEDVIEMVLAHSIGDDTVAAYKRTDLFRKRARLMQAWADYCLPKAKMLTPRERKWKEEVERIMQGRKGPPTPKELSAIANIRIRA